MHVQVTSSLPAWQCSVCDGPLMLLAGHPPLKELRTQCRSVFIIRENGLLRTVFLNFEKEALKIKKKDKDVTSASSHS